jgi:hypothetical protein
LALLIGNKDYTGKIQPLKAPHNDIMTVGNALAAVRFKVTALPNASRRQMLSAVKTFAAELAKGGPNAVGFLYYSGHGVARPEDRANYLIPVDLKDTSSTDFWFDAVKLDDLLGELQRAAPFAAHFVVFDACRDELKLPYKSAVKGFEPVAERSGMFIAFATALGAVALDEAKAGTTASGPYASALAGELVKPGQDHLQLFQNVKEAVLAATSGAQQPWESNGLARRIYLTGEPLSVAEVVEQNFWSIVQDSDNPAVLQTYLDRYPVGRYAEVAHATIEQRRRELRVKQAIFEAEQRRAEEERKATEAKHLEEVRVTRDRTDHVEAYTGVGRWRDAASDRVDAGQALGQLPADGGGEHWKTADARQDEHAFFFRNSVELSDPADEAAAIGQIEIADAERDCRLHQPIEVIAVGLEWSTSIDNDVGGERAYLCRHIASPVEALRAQGCLRIQPRTKGLRLRQGASRDDQLQLLLAGQQFHDPAAEHAVAADDQDAPAPLAHRRNRAAISGVGTKRVSLRPKKRSRLAASIS